MRLPLKERVFLSGVVIALAAVLVALAILQYRWAREVSDAYSVRLQANLDTSMLGWRDDLYRELTSVFSAFQVNPGQSSYEKAAQYAQQYQAWSQTATHANLIAHVFLVQNAGTKRSQPLQLNTASNQFEPVDWPADLEQLHGWIQDHSATMARAGRMVAHLHHRDGPPRGQPGATGMGRRPFGPDGFFTLVDVNTMALLRPQFHRPASSPGRQNGDRPAPVIDWIVVQLDRKVLQDHVLPELAERHFSGSEGLDYQVAVVSAPGSVVYSSDPGFEKQDTASVDGTMPVFGPPHGLPSQRGIAAPIGAATHFHANAPRDKNDFFVVLGPLRLDTIHYPNTDSDSNWQLQVRYRQGPLETVVTRIRHRNLALSFGVLLVLAAGIGIIVVSSQRARVLARLQMDFVAAVSHELRTPLAVISSAAENISDGVVAGKQQLTQYGTEIKNQAKHLIQLVEQILLFAATSNKRHQYNLRPVRVGEVIEAALKDTAGLIESAGVTVEQEIAPNLPPIMGDLPALTHCLQNLITNAVKYGGDARWMRIKAQVNDEEGQFNEVQIVVEDKGLGIGATELRRIFEPFYRSRSVAAAQIHGTGLGLSLARDIAQAMGGKLTVTSEPGKGSRFSLFLQFADVADLQTSPQTAAAVNPNLSKT